MWEKCRLVFGFIRDTQELQIKGFPSLAKSYDCLGSSKPLGGNSFKACHAELTRVLNFMNLD